MQKRSIINIIKNHNTNQKKVAEVIDFVNKSGGIQYAETKMHEYKNKALSILEAFPDSQSKSSLKELVLFTTERKN